MRVELLDGGTLGTQELAFEQSPVGRRSGCVDVETRIHVDGLFLRCGLVILSCLLADPIQIGYVFSVMASALVRFWKQGVKP